MFDYCQTQCVSVVSNLTRTSGTFPMRAEINASLRRVLSLSLSAEVFHSDTRILSVRGRCRGRSDSLTVRRTTSDLACLAFCTGAS